MMTRLLILVMLAGAARGEIEPALSGREAAPEFPAGLEWLNTDKPLSLSQLRGKIVLLDFWTYCCINCIHEMPQLKRLEAKFPNELVVIGVHSAKFTTEKGTQNIREAILRHELAHPVVNDGDFAIWKAYSVNAWPTFVLIDPEGRIARRKGGEGVLEAWEPIIAKMVEAWDGEKKLDRRPMKWAPERDRAPRSVLAFPGKVAVDAQRLAVSDSNHHRILLLALDGTVQEVIGGGEAGLKDGTFEEARFRQPQGVALSGQFLYVADTENHALREIDLKARRVRTLAGTGKQARRNNVPGVGVETQLNSPWDLLALKDHLYVAIAGPHQLWTYEFATQISQPFAGTGRETLLDGPLEKSALAQPSGITTDGTSLYFADAESSAIRRADLDRRTGQVETIVGKGLFEFGDVDGAVEKARLQHPLGVGHADGMLYVADTYNNKIKRIDLKQRRVETMAGSGKAGFAEGPAKEAMFNEPGGLAVAGNLLYVADTNNHAIRVIDLKQGTVSTLRISGLEKLRRKTELSGEIVKLDEQTVSAGEGEMALHIALPVGHVLNSDAPQYLAMSSSEANVIAAVEARNLVNPTLPITFPLACKPGRTTLRVELLVYYCPADHRAQCLVKPILLEIPVKVVEGAEARKLELRAVVR